jgi:phage recombination protein Bet
MNQVVVSQARLPTPQGVESGYWRILCEAIFPSANSQEAIIMAIDYCKARNLDILKKPVNIVPMWSSKKNAYVETVWPSINEIQVTASRTGKYAGMDEPKFGPMIEREFKGRKDNRSVGETSIKLWFPEYCSVTVYRMIDGQRCAFTEPVYWMESYGRIGKSELPNQQWEKRPMGMIIKVAKAFSLRAAFPEEGSYTAEEMEGKIVEEHEAAGFEINTDKKASAFKSNPLRKQYVENVAKAFDGCESLSDLNIAADSYADKFAEMEASGNDYDAEAVEECRRRYATAKQRIQQDEINRASFGDGFVDTVTDDRPVLPPKLPEGQEVPAMFRRVNV